MGGWYRGVLGCSGDEDAGRLFDMAVRKFFREGYQSHRVSRSQPCRVWAGDRGNDRFGYLYMGGLCAVNGHMKPDI